MCVFQSSSLWPSFVSLHLAGSCIIVDDLSASLGQSQLFAKRDAWQSKLLLSVYKLWQVGNISNVDSAQLTLDGRMAELHHSLINP